LVSGVTFQTNRKVKTHMVAFQKAPVSEFNKALARRVLERVFNQRHVAFIDELYPDCVFRSPSIGEVRGAAYRQFMRSVIAAFPGGRWRIRWRRSE
jgi:hypothetical protein